MTLLYDYYRPHSATLVSDENSYGELATSRERPVIEGSSGRLLPVQPCIVLDARDLKGNAATQTIALREGLVGAKTDEYIAAVDLGKYGSDVLRSMWGEIVDLRGQLRQLETTNRQLRQETESKQRRCNDNDDDDDSNNRRLSKNDERLEFGEKYDMLKKKLSKQTNDILNYRERIDQLREELSKKGPDEVKKVSQRSKPGSRSDSDLHLKLRNKDARMRELEMACRKQEQVIEQLEKLLEKRNDDLYERRTHDMLAVENRRLKGRLQQITDEEDEKIRLEDDFKERKRGEIMEERIKTLEKQILDNAKRWAQERTDLVMRLQEAEFGLNSHPLNGTFEKLPPNFSSSSRRNVENQSKSKSTTSKSQGLPNIYNR